jgi:hypothetical protein
MIGGPFHRRSHFLGRGRPAGGARLFSPGFFGSALPIVAALVFLGWPAAGSPVARHAPSRSGASHSASRRSARSAHSKRHPRSAHPSRAALRSARFVRSPQQASSNSALTPAAKTKSAKKHRRHRREPTQKAPTPERISEIQSALARNGFYEGDPNGKWDSKSVAAMEKFQSSNNLEPTGKFDALTLQKLGLGSDIAGVSAPKSVPQVSPVPAPSAPPKTSPDTPSQPPSKTPDAPSGSASASKPPHQ